MKILPLENRVLLKVQKEENRQTEGGLFVPGTHNEMCSRCTVEAVGPGLVLASGQGLETRKLPIEVGDTVLIIKGSGIDVNGMKLVEDSHILAKVEK